MNAPPTGPRTRGPDPTLSPSRIKALVWGSGVAFPLLVAVLVFFAEPPIDLSNPLSWAAAGVWILVAAAVSATLVWGKTPLQKRGSIIVLLLFMLLVVQLGNSTSSWSPAAVTIAAGFWGFFVGLAVCIAYVFGHLLRLEYCPTDRRYLWMAPVEGGRRCPMCKTLRPDVPGANLD